MAYTRQQMLESVEAAIVRLVSGGVSQTTVLGQSFTAESLDKLRAWRDQLKAEITAEAAGFGDNGAGFSNIALGDPSQGHRPAMRAPGRHPRHRVLRHHAPVRNGTHACT